MYAVYVKGIGHTYIKQFVSYEPNVENAIHIHIGYVHYMSIYNELPDTLSTHKTLWKIDGIGLPKLFINADSFDEALEIARKTDPNYTGGQVLWKGGD